MIATARKLFIVGATWNSLIGGSLLLFPETMIRSFYGASSGPMSPLLRMAFEDFGAMILLFGLGYFLVAINPERNHGIVLLGILGKLGITFVLPYRYFAGQATHWIFIPAVIDLGFALLFARFLLVSTWRDNVRD